MSNVIHPQLHPDMKLPLLEQPLHFISIVIVNFNGKKWLKRCLGSLSKQTYKNYEIILVDNCSNDGSVAFVRQSFPLVRIIKSPANVGFAGGNNLGVKQAKGDMILLLNNDTWVKNTFISQLTEEYINSSYDVISPHEVAYQATTPTRSAQTVTIDIMGHPVYKAMPSGANFYLPGACLLFSKNLYQETQGLDENFFMYCEEVDWFWRLLLLKKKFGFAKSVTVNHAGAGSTGAGIKYSVFLWRNQNTLQMLLKNYCGITLFFILPLYFAQNICEIIVFLLLGETKIASSYYEGWIFNVKNLKKTMDKRRWIQHNRTISDLEVMGLMYRGPGKLHHLIQYAKK